MSRELQLREWARGELPLEAATELLIRTGWAGAGRPWSRRDDAGRVWIDFASIPGSIAGLSGGERRVLRVAASLATEATAINLWEEIPGLDRSVVALVLAAIAHAAGVHVPGRTIEVVDGSPRVVDVDALYAWPAGVSRDRRA